MAPSSHPDLPHLLSPLRVGPLELRNRVFVSAHQPGLAEAGVPGERYIAYQRARARGGAALQITGATTVHPTGGYLASHMLANLDDRIVYGYRRLAEAVHAEGGRILAQLAHGGALGHTLQSDLPLWAPSPVAADLYRQIPHEMTRAEIAEIVQAFADAAWRVRSGGMDGVEINAAFGLLIAAFLSPYANHRTDEYGGGLDNRARFCLEVVEAVRRGAGPDLIVGVRIPGDERVEGGLDREQMKEVARRLEATGQVDFLNVIAGTNLDRFERVRHWPPTPAPHGLFVELAQGIKQVVRLPVFTLGRITDPRQAERILAAGQADMVGMTRAHIADPEIVRKVQAGRLDDIRPCVGANVCIGRLMDGASIRCLHNPETGREAEWGPLRPAATARRVAVVGGGPAGLEAARVAALRGHTVDLYERGPALGGQLRLWANSPAMRELAQVVEWQAAQLQALGVRVHLSTEVTAETLAVLAVDAVVIASGSRPQPPGEGWGKAGGIPIVSPQAVLAGEAPAAQRAVIWDKAGGLAALSAAETLAEAHARVEVVTPGFAVGEDVTITVRMPLYERLLAAGASFWPNCRVAQAEDDAVQLVNLYSGQTARLDGVDLIVDWPGNRADDSLWQPLQALAGQSGRTLEVHAVGDCVAPRLVETAMAEGAAVARDL
jgi:mycofactocin system FadH/OYE family oxidoreductase 2